MFYGNNDKSRGNRGQRFKQVTHLSYAIFIRFFVKCILRHFVTCISIAWRYCLDTKEYNLVQSIWYTSENKIKPKNTKYSKEYNILQRIQNTPKNTRYSKEYKILQRIQNTPKNTKYHKDYKILQRIQHTTKNTKYSKEYKILQRIQNTPSNTIYTK